MLKKNVLVTSLMGVGSIPANAQPSAYLDGIFVDQQLFRSCTAAGGKEAYCSCLHDTSSKHMIGVKNKRIWVTYLSEKTPTEAQRLRSQLSPAENQALDNQLRAADAAVDACNARFGVKR